MVRGDDRTRHAASRHQILAIETMLRAAELSPAWVGWMPESTCLPQLFLPQAHRLALHPPRVASDNALIREDGLRVFLELTTGTNKRLDASKIRSWSAMFDAGNFSGALLFICSDTHTAAGTADAIKAHASAKARERIFLSTWEEYFPDHGIVTADAASLRAVRFTGSDGNQRT